MSCRILYPISDNPACRNFTPQVLAVARRLGATVDLFHAAATRRDLPAAQAFLAAQPRPGVSVRRLAAAGPFRPALRAQMAAEPYDLLMMPARALPFWRRWTRHSVLAEIIRSSPIPVWTSWGGAPPAGGGFQIVAAGLDLHSLSRRVLLESATLAARLGARLELLHAIPRVDVDALSASSLADLPVALSPESAIAGLERLQRISGVAAPIHIDHGDPARVLPALARRHRADLLILGAGRRSLGENVMATIRAARGPVLILPAHPLAFLRPTQPTPPTPTFATTPTP